MTIKTPEQIARETLGADALAGIGYAQYLPYMIAAIEADRAHCRLSEAWEEGLNAAYEYEQGGVVPTNPYEAEEA